MKPTFLILSAFVSLVCHSQDSSKTWSFKKQINLWTNWQRLNYNSRVSMPEHTRNLRNTVVDFPTSFDSISDHPLLHGATYISVKTEFDFRKKVVLYADLYAEHRGVSYGLFDRNNTVLYPVLLLKAKDTLNLFSKPVVFTGRIGQMLDEKLDEGLMVYNMDLQGFQLTASLNKWDFQYTLYGDLQNGIGLNIDDLESYSVSKRFNGNDRIGVSWVLAIPSYYPLKNHYTLTVFGRKTFTQTKLYAQAGYRPYLMNGFLTEYNPGKQWAMVAGMETAKKTVRWTHQLQAAVRYYGFTYNLGYYEGVRLRYRQPALNYFETYANTVGPFLYPLRKFDAPFSQWAVFTEFPGFNIGMGTITGTSTFQLHNKFNYFLHYDINYVYGKLDKLYAGVPERSVSFLYPFFNTGFAYQPAENLSVRASVTNKTMNLDVHYPTLYLLRKPCFQISCLAEFH